MELHVLEHKKNYHKL